MELLGMKNFTIVLGPHSNFESLLSIASAGQQLSIKRDLDHVERKLALARNLSDA